MCSPLELDDDRAENYPRRVLLNALRDSKKGISIKRARNPRPSVGFRRQGMSAIEFALNNKHMCGPDHPV
jgi:hypothetical protein